MRPMLYTRKGDDGKTKTFGCDQRISKSSAVAEALGALDEANSYLGLCKVAAEASGFKLGGEKFSDIIHAAQENLFIIGAEMAGAGKSMTADKVKGLERLVDAAEKELPPIKTFFISGGTELAARFDTARTIARRMERRVIAVHEEGLAKAGDSTLGYVNRLSSLLYALARLSNHKSSIKESAPKYE